MDLMRTKVVWEMKTFGEYLEEFKKEIDTKNDIWTNKTAELYNYVAEYLNERGIPTSKAKEDQ